MKKRFPNAVHFFAHQNARPAFPGVIMPEFANGGKLKPGETREGTYQAKDQADYDFRNQKLQDSSDVYNQNQLRNQQIQQLGYKVRTPQPAQGITAKTLGHASKPGFFQEAQPAVQSTGNRHMVSDVLPNIYNPKVGQSMFIEGIDPVTKSVAMMNTDGIWKRSQQKGLQPNAPDAVEAYNYQAPRVTNILRPQPAQPVAPQQVAVQAPAPAQPKPAMKSFTQPRPQAQPKPAPAVAVQPSAPKPAPALPGRFQPNVPMPQDSTRPQYQNAMHQQAVQQSAPQYNKEIYNSWQVKPAPTASQSQFKPKNPNAKFEVGGFLGKKS